MTVTGVQQLVTGGGGPSRTPPTVKTQLTCEEASTDAAVAVRAWARPQTVEAAPVEMQVRRQMLAGSEMLRVGSQFRERHVAQCALHLITQPRP